MQRFYQEIKSSQIKDYKIDNRKKHGGIIKRPLTSMVAAERFVPHPLVAHPFGEHQVNLILLEYF